MTNELVDERDESTVSEGSSDAEPVTRRGMLSHSSLMMAAGVASAPLWFTRSTASANPGRAQHTLVILFLRGGCDGLSMVAPRLATGGPDVFYETQRQTPAGGRQLAIPQPGPGNGVIALTDSASNQIPWMLSEGAAAAYPMYQAGDLAFVHGVGLPVVNNGSHFFSQDYMEDGTFSGTSDGLGWAGRAMQAITSTQIWRGMGYGKLLQRTLFGAPKTVAIPDPANYDLNGAADSKELRKLALGLLFNVADEPLKSTAADSLDTVEKINGQGIFLKPSTATYPDSVFGEQMKRTQQLIQASADPSIDVNLETVMMDYGDWDNHTQMGPTPTPGDPNGEGMHNRMKDVFESMAAFYTDLKTHAPNANYTLAIVSEFGRRLTANGNAGVDHGKGLPMAIMGSSGVNGQNVFTMLSDNKTPGWAGLQAHSVLQTGSTTSYNLLDTIDYRRVLGEILEKRLGLTQAEVRGVFPGYDYGLFPETSSVGALL